MIAVSELQPYSHTSSLKPGMAANGNNGRRYPQFVFGDTLSVAFQTFRIGKMRFILTSLGMVIGTASLILVVTIGLTGKQYLLQQIQNIGSNMMIAEYAGRRHLWPRRFQRLPHSRRLECGAPAGPRHQQCLAHDRVSRSHRRARRQRARGHRARASRASI